MFNLAPVLATAGVSVSPTAIIIGILASLLAQWSKNSTKVPFLTPEMTKTLTALVALVSVLGGLGVAASQPGGLASVDWKETLTVVFENAAVIWFAATNFYQHVIKPNAKSSEPFIDVPHEVVQGARPPLE